MPIKKSKNFVKDFQSTDSSVSESESKPFCLPETKSYISDSASDYWSLSVVVNKRLWRSLSFREQALVNRLISNLQEGLEDALNAKFLQLLEKHSASLGGEGMESVAEVLPVVDPVTGEMNF